MKLSWPADNDKNTVFALPGDSLVRDRILDIIEEGDERLSNASRSPANAGSPVRRAGGSTHFSSSREQGLDAAQREQQQRRHQQQQHQLQWQLEQHQQRQQQLQQLDDLFRHTHVAAAALQQAAAPPVVKGLPALTNTPKHDSQHTAAAADSTFQHSPTSSSCRATAREEPQWGCSTAAAAPLAGVSTSSAAPPAAVSSFTAAPAAAPPPPPPPPLPPRSPAAAPCSKQGVAAGRSGGSPPLWCPQATQEEAAGGDAAVWERPWENVYQASSEVVNEQLMNEIMGLGSAAAGAKGAAAKGLEGSKERKQGAEEPKTQVEAELSRARHIQTILEEEVSRLRAKVDLRGVEMLMQKQKLQQAEERLEAQSSKTLEREAQLATLSDLYDELVGKVMVVVVKATVAVEDVHKAQQSLREDTEGRRQASKALQHSLDALTQVTALRDVWLLDKGSDKSSNPLFNAAAAAAVAAESLKATARSPRAAATNSAAAVAAAAATSPATTTTDTNGMAISSKTPTAPLIAARPAVTAQGTPAANSSSQTERAAETTAAGPARERLEDAAEPYNAAAEADSSCDRRVPSSSGRQEQLRRASISIAAGSTSCSYSLKKPISPGPGINRSLSTTVSLISTTSKKLEMHRQRLAELQRDLDSRRSSGPATRLGSRHGSEKGRLPCPSTIGSYSCEAVRLYTDLDDFDTGDDRASSPPRFGNARSNAVGSRGASNAYNSDNGLCYKNNALGNGSLQRPISSTHTRAAAVHADADELVYGYRRDGSSSGVGRLKHGQRHDVMTAPATPTSRRVKSRCGSPDMRSSSPVLAPRGAAQHSIDDTVWRLGRSDRRVPYRRSSSALSWY